MNSACSASSARLIRTTFAAKGRSTNIEMATTALMASIARGMRVCIVPP